MIAIIGILSATVLGSLNNSRIKGRDASRINTLKQFQNGLELYRTANNGNYPCATANPACADTGAAAPAFINSDSPDMDVITALQPYFRPATDTAQYPTNGTIQYRVRSLTGNNSSPDRLSYTIAARFETARVNNSGTSIPAGDWCRIDMGPGHSGWATYPPCF